VVADVADMGYRRGYAVRQTYVVADVADGHAGQNRPSILVRVLVVAFGARQHNPVQR
jgi:hypothetical protein